MVIGGDLGDSKPYDPTFGGTLIPEEIAEPGNCLPCTGFTTWREQLRIMRPEFFKWLNQEYQKSVGEPTLWEYEDRYDICLETEVDESDR